MIEKRLLALMMALCLMIGLLPATAEEPVDEWVPEVEEFDLGANEADEISLEEAAAGDDAPLAAGEEIALGSPELAEEAARTCVVESEPWYCELDSALTPEERFEGYIARYFYDDSRVPMASDYACQSLNAAERALYDLVKAEILKIADGQRTNTEIKISPSQLPLKEFYTPQELGVTLRYENFLPVNLSEMRALVCDNEKVRQALSLDCPYELYFSGGYGGNDPFELVYNDALETHVLKANPSKYFLFAYSVSEEYRLNGAPYELDPAAVRKARQAAANARAIVAKYADYPDYARLYAYAAEVCHWVDYKTSGGSGTFGDLGLVVAVFDGDPSTKVQCGGYAMAFQYLCGLADFRGDVRCIRVDGVQGGNHAWNVVRMDDGRNYLVDVTNMDYYIFDQEPTDALIAKWLNRREGSFFLCGGSGSVSDGYSVAFYNGGNIDHWKYRYYTNIMTYSSADLALAGGEYRPVGFMTIGSKTYFWGANGHFLTGWQKIGDTVLQFDSDGALLSGVSAGWQKIGGKWYYIDQAGSMATGWRQIGGKWYCFDASGTMMTGWQRQNGVYYCFDASGAMLTGWQRSGGKWYYLNSSGAMATGWQRVGGQWYHFAGGGAMQTGWQQIGNYYYCFNNSGAMMTGWQAIGGKWYYFGGSGAMATGWQNLGGKWYYFTSGGAMATGWQAVGGRWYYFNASGTMATGWQRIGSSWFYFGTSGAMVTGRQTIGGRVYTFNNSGVWIG